MQTDIEKTFMHCSYSIDLDSLLSSVGILGEVYSQDIGILERAHAHDRMMAIISLTVTQMMRIESLDFE